MATETNEKVHFLDTRGLGYYHEHVKEIIDLSSQQVKEDVDKKLETYTPEMPDGTVVSEDTGESLEDPNIPNRDADTLGGTYSATDITLIKKEIDALQEAVKNGGGSGGGSGSGSGGGGSTPPEPSIPDGSTVELINDVQTWLKCADITDKDYATVSQVLTDDTTMLSLTMNENSMKYLARSTDFANELCSNETFMTYLGQCAYADDTVLNNDLWLNSICDSAYFEKVLNTKVPTMTSDTEPIGEAFASSFYNTNSKAFIPFNGNPENWWSATVADSQAKTANVGYKFASPVCVNKTFVRAYYDEQMNSRLVDFKIQASNDDTNWVDLGSYKITSESGQYFVMSNTNHYLSYRVLGLSNTNNNAICVRKIQFYGRTPQALTFDKSVTISGAVNECILVYDNDELITWGTTNANGTGIMTVPGGKELKFVGSISGYEKTVSISDDTTEVRVMPDGALYWYGNECTDLTGGWTGDGYSWYLNGDRSWSTTDGGITFNTNDVYLTGRTSYPIPKIGTSNVIDFSNYSSICADYKATGWFSNGVGLMLYVVDDDNKNNIADKSLAGRNLNSSTRMTESLNISTIEKSSHVVIMPGIANQCAGYYYAVWLE